MRTGQPAPGGSEIIGLIDIGSSKIACLIVALPAPSARGEVGASGVRVLGIGHQRSAGVKAGVITDMEAAEAAILATVSQAERAAGVRVDTVVVAVSCGRLKSATFAAHATIDGGIVGDGDIARALTAGRAYAERDGRTLVHMTRVGYRLDGAAGVEDPRGMAAGRLTADLHAVTADDAPVRNLLLAVERCHLTTAGLIAAPYAGAVAVTTREERQLGVTAIDMGGGATTIAMFAEGHFLHTDAVAVGGHHLTIDIARALSAPLAESERIKALYGTLVAARSDESEPITYPRAGEDEETLFTTTKAHVRSIIAPRVDSLLRLVGERIAQAPAASLATRHIVLTGGSAQLVGLAEHAANVLGCPVRVARPVPVGGLPASVCSPAFAVVVGLLTAVSSGDVAITAYRDRDTLGSGYLQRVGAWLREF